MQLFALAEAASAEPERPDTAQVIPMAVGR